MLVMTWLIYLLSRAGPKCLRTSDASTGSATAGAASASSRSVTASGLHNGTPTYGTHATLQVLTTFMNRRQGSLVPDNICALQAGRWGANSDV